MQATAALRRLFCLGIALQASIASAQTEPLHAQIDKLLTPVAGVTPATASDAEFLRRASLDLVGIPPTADEARAFLADASPDKRAKLLDRLFASPHFVRHFAQVLDLMLMERRPAANVSVDEWHAWLAASVRENKPWNVMAKEVLLADGADAAKRAPVRFALDRGSDPNVLTRDIGRVFFGRDMQCAQCHDHPIVSHYLQSDYQGLLAFVQPTYAVTKKEGDKQMVVAAERVGGNVSFESVFLHVPRRTGPRVPDGVVIDEPFYLPGEDYQVAPGENVLSIPKFSYRTQLAELATNGSNDAFNRNIANRLWAMMFGRGLVHPLDMHNPDNPASNPELLDLLAAQFVAMKFDMRAFLRELALTSAYQRSFDPPAIAGSLSEQATKQATELEAQRVTMAKTAEVTSDEFTKAADAWEKMEAATIPVAGELDTAKNQYAEAKKKMDEATKAAADASTQLEAKKTAVAPVQQAATAAEAAVKVLPADKELADAAQKFIARAQQLAAEAATLTKTVEEKTAAVAPVTEAWTKTKPPVETALQKVKPLTTSLKEAEKAMLAAREKAEREKERLAALDRRLETARKVAEFSALNQNVVAAAQAVATQETAVASAQKQHDEFVAIVATHEAAAKAQAETVAAAGKAVEAARAEHAKRVEAANAVTAAFQATDAARLKAPLNGALTTAAANAQESLKSAQAIVAESQKALDAAVAAHKAADQAFVAGQEALAGKLAEKVQREQALVAAKTAAAAAKADLAAKQTALDPLAAELNDRWTRDFTIATLKPLSPEQLCWSVFRATGVYDRHWQAEVAELDKAKPLTDEQKKDATQVAARGVELEQRTYDKLKPNIGTFVSLYGAAAGQPQGDFFATADQALFVANGGAVNSWVVPAGDNVTERIVKKEDPNAAAEELYLSLFTRMPTDTERTEVANYLKDRTKDKPAAAQELVWALLNSAEFRFNH
jgi:hypothetical protein